MVWTLIGFILCNSNQINYSHNIKNNFTDKERRTKKELMLVKSIAQHQGHGFDSEGQHI